MPLDRTTDEPPDVLTVADILREMMMVVERETRFSSAPIDESTATFRGALEFCSTPPERREKAIRKTVELLEEFPWIALALLRRLAPEPHPVILKENQGRLLAIVETWLRWAQEHGYITERSHHFLAWIQVTRGVQETCEALLKEWKTGRTRGAELIQLGRQYPSVVLGEVLSGWALNAGERRPEEWHELMAAMTGITDPVKSMLHAPIAGSADDPGFPLARWVEWYQRWRPTVAPFALWPSKEETEKR